MPDAPRVGCEVERPLSLKRSHRRDSFNSCSSDSEDDHDVKKVKSKAEPQRKVLKPSHHSNTATKQTLSESGVTGKPFSITEPVSSQSKSHTKLSKKGHSMKPSKRVVYLPKDDAH